MHFKDVNAKEPTDGWADHEVERATQKPALQLEGTGMVPESELQAESTGSGIIIYRVMRDLEYFAAHQNTF